MSEELLEQISDAESEGTSEMYAQDPSDSIDMLEDDFESETDPFGDGMEMGEAEFGEDNLDFEGEEDYFGGESEESGEDSFIGGVLGNALGAEEEDEFLGKLFKGVKAIAQKAAPIIGKAARFAGPLLSKIPHPWAQIGGQVANVLGKLRAEGASTEDALEAVAEIAVRDRRALPVVAGLAARTLVKNRGASMSPQQRRQAVKSATRAAKTLVANGGPKAIRALPRVAQSVRRATAAKGTPAAVRPKVLQRTAAKVAQKPALLQRLSRPSQKGQSIVRRSGGMVRSYGGGGGDGSYTVNGPARISINVV